MSHIYGAGAANCAASSPKTRVQIIKASYRRWLFLKKIVISLLIQLYVFKIVEGGGISTF
jgi:hypothetical protein